MNGDEEPDEVALLLSRLEPLESKSVLGSGSGSELVSGSDSHMQPEQVAPAAQSVFRSHSSPSSSLPLPQVESRGSGRDHEL